MKKAHDSAAKYELDKASGEAEILAQAEAILRKRCERLGTLSNPSDSMDFLRMRLGGLQHEEFHVLWLDNKNRILDCQKLFIGTVDGAQVHPREVLREALKINACGAVFAHNHPSQVPLVSGADIAITKELVSVLKMIGVRVLDHIVVGETCVSMASTGLM
jgi:DNA repair protein RadC